jgi:two-component system, OmpR family, phosphate regulon response regulator PhoB
MRSILSVEDSPDSQRLIARALGSEFRVVFAQSLQEATEKLEAEVPDLVLLDVSLPDGDGFQLCSLLQTDDRTRDIPILLLTARSEVRDRIMAFSLGADDYVEKPFDLLELRTRVEARLRKSAARADRGQVIRKGKLRIDVTLHRVEYVTDGGEQEISLTPHEFRVLCRLASHEHRVFTRGQLLADLWNDVVVTERTVDTHVSNLRRKLGGAGHYVKSVRGVGYRFDPSGD